MNNINYPDYGKAADDTGRADTVVTLLKHPKRYWQAGRIRSWPIWSRIDYKTRLLLLIRCQPESRGRDSRRPRPESRRVMGSRTLSPSFSLWQSPPHLRDIHPFNRSQRLSINRSAVAQTKPSWGGLKATPEGTVQNIWREKIKNRRLI